MIRAKRSIILSLVLAMAMLFTGTFATKVYAEGTETLPVGIYNISTNGFTFTDTNLTKVKTMPANANTLVFGIKFRKATTDQGIGQVKLKFQIRDTRGNVIQEKVVTDTGNRNGYTMFVTDPITVSPGQQFQLYFDAISVNPSESNGNYRSIEISIFRSFINQDTIVF